MQNITCRIGVIRRIAIPIQQRIPHDTRNTTLPCRTGLTIHRAILTRIGLIIPIPVIPAIRKTVASCSAIDITIVEVIAGNAVLTLVGGEAVLAVLAAVGTGGCEGVEVFC